MLEHRTSYFPAIPENSARKSTRLTTVIRIAGSHIPDAIEFITNGRTLAVAIDDLFSRGFAAPPSHRNVLTDGHARLLARMRSGNNSHVERVCGPGVAPSPAGVDSSACTCEAQAAQSAEYCRQRSRPTVAAVSDAVLLADPPHVGADLTKSVGGKARKEVVLDLAVERTAED